MTVSETDLLVMNAADHQVLRAYWEAEQQGAALPVCALEEADAPYEPSRWVARLRHVEGVPPEHMPPSHGRLIAGGYLQFQLEGRDAGMLYRLTSQGRAALSATPAEAPLEDSLRRTA
jgi:hypothetical protein